MNVFVDRCCREDGVRPSGCWWLVSSCASVYFAHGAEHLFRPAGSGKKNGHMGQYGEHGPRLRLDILWCSLFGRWQVVFSFAWVATSDRPACSPKACEQRVVEKYYGSKSKSRTCNSIAAAVMAEVAIGGRCRTG